MNDNTSITALKSQIALGLVDADQLATLDRRTRREVEKACIEMAGIAKKHMAAQEVIGVIHMLTLHNVSNTLASAEFIKSMRSPLISGSDLEQMDIALRSNYLEAVGFSGNNAMRNVLAKLE